MKSEGTTSLDWGKVRFFLGEVGRNFTRNAGMQATAIGTVALTIVLLGSFLYIRAGMAHLGSDVFNQITISVYMKQSATKDQEHRARTELLADPRVSNVQFVSKEEGLREMRKRLKGEIDTSILTSNPLPDKLVVRVHNPEQVPAVAKNLRAMEGVGDVEYGREVVGRLLQIAAVARKVGIALIAILILIAAVIISNTIRLTVFARRREIAIMQLVGATNTYIRMPFICEGLLAGVTGTLLAIGFLAAVRASLVPKLAMALPWLQMNVIAIDLSALVLQLLAIGAAIGIISSWFAVGRYLRT